MDVAAIWDIGRGRECTDRLVRRDDPLLEAVVHELIAEGQLDIATGPGPQRTVEDRTDVRQAFLAFGRLFSVDQLPDVGEVVRP